MRRVLVLLAVATLALSSCSESRDEPALEALADSVVAAGAPGVLVAVRRGEDVRSVTRGFADGGRSMRIRPDDRFRIGSVTKTFVAVLVLQLAEDGRLRLDDPVERWLPGLVPGGRRITVRHLLSHTAGLPDYVEDPRVFRDPDRRWAPRELVALAVAHHLAPPGRFAYSSTSYLVLGLIAERAGGAPLGRQLRERLFRPLGLRRTSFVPGAVHGRHVHGFRAPSHQGIVTGPPVDTGGEPAWWTWAAGGMVSTAGDLQRFFRSLLRGRVLSPPLMRELETRVPAGRQRYGLGIATFPTPCGPAWGHTGNILGTVTVVWNTRDASRQVVVVVNTYPLSPALEEAVRRVQLAAFCDDRA
jgi:D-alanyl-D-alanine carboxypeptidase